MQRILRCYDAGRRENRCMAEREMEEFRRVWRFTRPQFESMFESMMDAGAENS